MSVGLIAAVEDEKLLLMLYERFLKLEEYDFIGFSNTNDFLAQVSGLEAELYIIDGNISKKGDGLGLIRVFPRTIGKKLWISRTLLARHLPI